MQFGEGTFLRAFVDYFYDVANPKASYNRKVKLVQAIGNFPQMADWITRAGRVCTPCTSCAAARGPEGGRKAGDLHRVRLRVPHR